VIRHFFYMANASGNNVTACAVDMGSGALPAGQRITFF
jgi:hypothetical protein